MTILDTLLLALVLLPPFLWASSASTTEHNHHHDHHDGVREEPVVRGQRHQQRQRRKQPNFVIVLTDDLDWTLGGLDASTLQRSRKLIGNAGKIFTNWFVQTPVCCPSRAELLTGKMYHNLRLPSLRAGAGCMHIDVLPHPTHPFYERDYFAQYFQQLNYTVGIFGKHLNMQNPTDFIPKGVDHMLINGGGVYLDPTFTVGTRVDDEGEGESNNKPQEIKFDNCTESTGMPCYSTSVIGNASLAWIKRHVVQQQSSSSSSSSTPKPFLALISVKAPHILDGPDFPMSIPAPWYTNTTIPEQVAPRLPNYNYSAPDHHWLVRTQLPLTQLQAQKVDELYISRLKTMISVDDLVEDLVQMLGEDDLRVLNETYIIFTSDNGFRLGQFQMPQCKLHPYENDIRVPMMIRGPGIRPGTKSDLLSHHVNLMPTLLGLADAAHNNHQHHHHASELPPQDSQSIVPATMDGMNLASHIVDTTTTNGGGGHNNNNDDRPTCLLMEYMSLGEVRRYQHLIDTYNHTFLALRIIHPAGSNNNNRTSNTAANTNINWKYIEFRDSRIDWNCSQPPLEREFYDLDVDPFELHNKIDQVSPMLLKKLSSKMQRLFHCQGNTCCQEHLQQDQQYWGDFWSPFPSTSSTSSLSTTTHKQ